MAVRLCLPVYQGKVTYSDKFFQFFELNHSQRIYLCFLDGDNPVRKLPAIGSTVALTTTCYRKRNTWIVYNEHDLSAIFEESFYSNPFVEYVNQKQLQPHHLLSVDQWITKLNKKFPLLIDEIPEFIFGILNLLVDQTLISGFTEIETATGIHFAEVTNEVYKDFPPWTYGTHRLIRGTNLFGLAKIDKTFGSLLICEGGYRFCALYSNSDNKSIGKIVNNYVLITEFIVVTEVFNHKEAHGIEYVYFDLRNVNKISSHYDSCKTLFRPDPPRVPYICNIYFTVIRKSPAWLDPVDPDYFTRFWLHIYVKELNFEKQSFVTIFLRLPQWFARVMLAIEEGQDYIINFFHPLRRINDPNIAEIARYPQYELLDGSFEITECEKKNKGKTERIFTVKECANLKFAHNQLITMEGVIKRKRLGNKYSKNTTKDNPPVLIFSYNEDGKERYLNCYLNYWHMMAMPAGLVPEMRVLAKHIFLTTNNYLKCSMFTTFEPIAYEPAKEFNSVDLCEGNEAGCSFRKSFLSKGSTFRNRHHSSDESTDKSTVTCTD